MYHQNWPSCRLVFVLFDKCWYIILMCSAKRESTSGHRHDAVKARLAVFFRQYLDGDVWSIFLSVVQISTKYRLTSKNVKYRLIVLTGTLPLGTIGTMRTLCHSWRQVALAPTMASGTLTPQPSA